jgi:acyl-CoA thioester hydrolase
MRVPIETRYNDYDSRGHVNNAVYLSYFEAARWKLWLEHFAGEPDPPVIIAEATVRYLRPALMGVPLLVDITLGEMRTRSWTWNYRVLDARDETPLAEGTTVLVYFDYETRQPAPIPESIRERLASA